MENCQLLILHGWGSSSRSWSAVKEVLCRLGCEVFVPDLPGFGSNPSPVRPWSIEDYAEWVREYSEKKNLSHFFLLGHSFGGGVAVKFASRYPGKVRALILVAPALVRIRGVKYYLVFALAKIGKLVLSVPGFSPLKVLAAKILYSVFGSKDYYKAKLEKTVTMKETFKKVVSENLLPFLPGIEKPVLLVWGKEDSFTSFKHAALVKERTEKAELKAVEGRGHALNLEMPEELAKITFDFIKKI